MSSATEDLRKAIQEGAFIRAKSGTVIVASEISGERANWVFDFRAVMLQPHWLDRYAEIFWEKYADRYPFQVCGMETAGIPLVAAIVMKSVQRGTPVNGFYIRKSRKRENLMKQIEGTVTDEPVIIVDDLINFGRVKNKEVKVLEEAGKKVLEIFVLLRFRDISAYAFAASRSIPVTSLFTLQDFGLEMLASDSSHVPNEAFDVVWHFKGPDPSFHLVVQKSAPVIDESRVFFGADSGAFYALDQTTGEVVWEFNVGDIVNGKSILSTPAVHGGTVYFGAYDGNVYALDAATGKKVWLNSDADYIGSSPALAPDLDLLFIGLEFGLWGKKGGIAAIDMRTGKAKWVRRHPELTHGSPIYIKEEGMVVIGSNDGILYAYEAKTGELLWTYATQGDIKVSPAYDPKRRIVFAGSWDGNLYALSARNGIPLYAKRTGGAIYSIPLVHNDTVYVASTDKKIYAIDIDTWQDRWAFQTWGRIFGAPTIADASLWCGSNDGCLYEIDPETGALRNFFQATERVMSKIAYNATTKRIFFRTAANEVYCLERKRQ